MSRCRMLVIVPSRGRPEKANELFREFIATSEDAALVFVCSRDDSTIAHYPPGPMEYEPYGSRRGMTAALNYSACNHAGGWDYLGFMGDDHRPRTQGWDLRVIEALDEIGTGIVYCNDLFQSENLPTAVFMSSDIVRALGYMAPPEQDHLYLDDAWLALGRVLGAIRYLPDVVIEHMHPSAGKAELDDGYARVNSAEMYDHDRAAFTRWLTTLPHEVQKIRASASVS